MMGSPAHQLFPSNFWDLVILMKLNTETHVNCTEFGIVTFIFVISNGDIPILYVKTFIFSHFLTNKVK